MDLFSRKFWVDVAVGPEAEIHESDFMTWKFNRKKIHIEDAEGDGYRILSWASPAQRIHLEDSIVELE